jgi:hypothetical protein
MIFLLQLLVFLAALAGIGLCSVGTLYFAGPTFSKARTPSQRRLSAALMVLCLCGIVASATAGFVGVGAVMYYAQQ